MNDVTIEITHDGATPFLRDIRRIASDPEVMRGAMGACVDLTQNYIRSLPTNRRGWPSTGFYEKGAQGTHGEITGDGFQILIDNEDAPGAMRFRHYCYVNGSGTITMKDKLLTIPARQEFYGKKATDFDNLRFVMFKSGAKALVIGKGGTGIVDFATGRSKTVRGAGARTAMMIAFWLVESVTQTADHDVIPNGQAYIDTVKNIYMTAYRQLMEN